ncbi:hypothetical protein, partial [Salmonella enterica]
PEENMVRQKCSGIRRSYLVLTSQVLFSVLTVQNSLPQVALLHLLTVKIIIFSQENMVRRVSLKKLLKQNKNKGALQPLHLVFW